MNLLAAIEAMRRNLKTVLLGCCAALALLMAADVALRLAHAPAAGEHGAVSAPAEHGTEAEHGPAAAEHDVWTRAYHVAEGMPVFWTAFGILGCLLLVAASKGILATLVSQPEDYYGE